MSLLVPVAIVGGLGVLALLASNESEGRGMWLIQGKTYSFTAKLEGPGWAAEQYPGFCNFSVPVVVQEGPGWAVLQWTADWCAPNRQFIVPDNFTVTEVG